MGEAFLNEMKSALEKEKSDLQSELDSVSSPDTGDHVPGDRAPEFPNLGDDNLDENSASPAEVAEYSLNADVTGTLNDKLKSVEAALERLENNTFGQCDKCSNEIAEARLRANPAADLCMTCAG
jgi:RNA polymerase-binding transcription factor DksA